MGQKSGHSRGDSKKRKWRAGSGQREEKNVINVISSKREERRRKEGMERWRTKKESLEKVKQ